VVLASVASDAMFSARRNSSILWAKVSWLPANLSLSIPFTRGFPNSGVEVCDLRHHSFVLDGLLFTVVVRKDIFGVSMFSRGTDRVYSPVKARFAISVTVWS
jgi:hypothetical protein